MTKLEENIVIIFAGYCIALGFAAMLVIFAK